MRETLKNGILPFKAAQIPKVQYTKGDRFALIRRSLFLFLLLLYLITAFNQGVADQFQLPLLVFLFLSPSILLILFKEEDLVKYIFPSWLAPIGTSGAGTHNSKKGASPYSFYNALNIIRCVPFWFLSCLWAVPICKMHITEKEAGFFV